MQKFRKIFIHSCLYSFICSCVLGSMLDAEYEKVKNKHIVLSLRDSQSRERHNSMSKNDTGK